MRPTTSRFPLIVLIFSTLAVISARQPAAAEFSYKTVLYSYLKLSPDISLPEYGNDLMQIYRPELWAKYQNDEFALSKARKETVQSVQAALARWNNTTSYVINTTTQFGKYDFDRKSYDLHPFAESTVFTVNNCCTQFPNTFTVSFDNPDILDGIPMTEDRAKSFLEQRKSGGFINRRVNLVVNFDITSLSGDNELLGHITRVDVLDPLDSNKLLFSALESHPEQ
jgi:hypothetical protein